MTGHAKCEARIAGLEEEIKQLKRRLAGKSISGVTPGVRGGQSMDSYLASLAPQDRAFFERRLGKKGK